jgi:hypothetical protein
MQAIEHGLDRVVCAAAPTRLGLPDIVHGRLTELPDDAHHLVLEIPADVEGLPAWHAATLQHQFHRGPSARPWPAVSPTDCV